MTNKHVDAYQVPLRMGSRSMTNSSYEVKKIFPIREPYITCPSVPKVPYELIEAYSLNTIFVLEEVFPTVWTAKDDEHRNWCIIRHEVIKETRNRLRNLATILKCFKRPLERHLTERETEQTFLTIEALFWHHLDLYQSLIDGLTSSSNLIPGLLLHFVKASCLDHAIIFTCFPNNLDFLEELVAKNPTLQNLISSCNAQVEAEMPAIGSHDDSLAKHMGHFYRRLDVIKNQAQSLRTYGPKDEQTIIILNEILTCIEEYEKHCGTILSVKSDTISLFDALSKTQSSRGKESVTNAFEPLNIPFDRGQSLELTVRQMESNSKVRYNQAVFKVHYQTRKPGRATTVEIMKEQVSISLFSRHVALLVIVFEKKKMFQKSDKRRWSYRLLYPLLPFSQVWMYAVPETPKTPNMIEMKIKSVEGETELLVFKCESAKHKKDLLQQFRLVQSEACPKDDKAGFSWIHESKFKTTKSSEQMIESEQEKKYATFSSSLCPSSSVKASRPPNLVILTQAENASSDLPTGAPLVMA